ncbi:unnamed protein product [Linum tenue]|uniref:Fucosyltransferase n=1 Tax=Linum tenue TaxID=586396 RepID=A0AAV0KGM6_9ROSI|nr:unnamed protein product [Linum tenue]
MDPTRAVAAMAVASLLLIIIGSRRTPRSCRNFPLERSCPSSEQTCVSREKLQSFSSRNSNHHISPPSPYLLSRLLEYEQHHKRCDPLSKPFDRTSKNEDLAQDCRYIVFTPGNDELATTMLSLSSSFLYALLTDRVLLVDFDPSMIGLFCEPFRKSTWLLPGEFTFRDRARSAEFRQVFSLGHLMRKQNQKQDQKLQADTASLLFLYLSMDYDDHDKLFYRDETQELLKNVPWLVLRSEQYFLPYFFLLPCFRTELDKLFPDDKETVFHHLGRYLFNPSNQAWGAIARFYDDYLVKAEQRVGLEIKVGNPYETPPYLMLPHILKCIQEESKILPRLQQNNTTTRITILPSFRRKTSKVILVESLLPEFYSELKNMYSTRPIADGEGSVSVRVYRTSSHEGMQKSDRNYHNMKALVDVYLLSMCDVLVISPFSTFGYVASGLAGLNPWFLKNPGDYETKPLEPACRRAVSPEPCFLFHPGEYVPNAVHHCRGRLGPVPVILYCEDFVFGFKLGNLKC